MIELLVMDVDGTLTDGRIHISGDGELFKTFDVKDGYGIREVLPLHHIRPVIITGRRSRIVERRAGELGIERLYQGMQDKGACIKKVSAELNVPLSRIACIGDDRNDLPMLRLCGVRGCPGDADPSVRAICDYICKANGGYGAVREFIEWLVQEKV